MLRKFIYAILIAFASSNKIKAHETTYNFIRNAIF